MVAMPTCAKDHSEPKYRGVTPGRMLRMNDSLSHQVAEGQGKRGESGSGDVECKVVCGR